LRAYPAAYRRERGEEIIGTLLEGSADGQAWPRLRDARTLAVGGLKVRAVQNRRRTTAVNLRTAILVGIAVYLSLWIANYLSSMAREIEPNPPSPPGFAALPALLTGLLVATTVLLAWLAPRIVVLTGALAVAAVFCFVAPDHFLAGSAVTPVTCLAGLVALRPRAARPSRRWLWLIGAFFVVAQLASLPRAGGSTYVPTADQATLLSILGLGSGPLFQAEQLLEALLCVAVVSIAWIGIDARLAIAVATFLTLTVVQSEATAVTVGAGIYAPLPFLLLVAVVAAPAVWLLRRQSAGGVAAGAK